MQNLIDNNLWELQKAANSYKSIDPLADWVLFALSKYIYSEKSSRAFEKAFAEYNPADFPNLIKRCLNGDKSDDGIIKTCKRIFHCQ